MSTNPNKPSEYLDVAGFVANYGTVPIQVGTYPKPIPLAAAVAMQDACPVERRPSEEESAHFLAKKLDQEGALQLHHLHHLIPPPPNEL